MLYSVHVKPGSKKGPLIMQTQDELIVFLRERPIDGAANQALIRLLAKYFQVSKSQVIIKKGANSHRKLVEIVK